MYSCRSVMCGLLISINCHAIASPDTSATDSTRIAQMALKRYTTDPINTDRLVPKAQKIVPDIYQCRDGVTAPKKSLLGGIFFYGTSVSTCPTDYPLPNTVASASDKTVFKCCKAKIVYDN